MIGDVVSVARTTGLWVIIGPAATAIPPGSRWRVRHFKGGVEFVAGEGDLALVFRPELTPGQKLSLNGDAVEVFSVADDRVRLRVPAEARRVALPHGGHVAFGEGFATVELGMLVSQNVTTLLAQGG